MTICHSVSTACLVGKYSYSSTLAKYLPGHLDRFPTNRVLDHSTQRMTLIVRPQVIWLPSINDRRKSTMPISMATLSKAWFCCLSLVGIAGSNTAEGTDVCLLWVLVCCQVEVSATGRSLVQRSRTECVGVCVSLIVIRWYSNSL